MLRLTRCTLTRLGSFAVLRPSRRDISRPRIGLLRRIRPLAIVVSRWPLVLRAATIATFAFASATLRIGVRAARSPPRRATFAQLALVPPRPVSLLRRVPQLALGEVAKGDIAVLAPQLVEGGQQLVTFLCTERGRSAVNQNRPVCVARRHVRQRSTPAADTASLTLQALDLLDERGAFQIQQTSRLILVAVRALERARDELSFDARDQCVEIETLLREHDA